MNSGSGEVVGQSTGNDPYLVSGLAEDLIADLSRYDGFDVLWYNCGKKTGFELPPKYQHVSNIVEMSVRRIHESLRITGAEQDAIGEVQQWSERWDVSVSSLKPLQARIGGRNADILVPGHAAPSAVRPSLQDANAYDRYLKRSKKHFRYEPEAFAKELEHFEAAVVLDPNFAAAFVQQADRRTTL